MSYADKIDAGLVTLDERIDVQRRYALGLRQIRQTVEKQITEAEEVLSTLIKERQRRDFERETDSFRASKDHGNG